MSARHICHSITWLPVWLCDVADAVGRFDVERLCRDVDICLDHCRMGGRGENTMARHCSAIVVLEGRAGLGLVSEHLGILDAESTVFSRSIAGASRYISYLFS